jgi:hypothetical protein
LEVADRRLVTDRRNDHVAPFLGLADAPDADAVGRLIEGREIAVDVLRVGQLTGRADNTPKELERARDGARRRQMIDQLGRNTRVLEVLLDLRRVLGVDALRGLRLRNRRVRRERNGEERDGGAEPAHEISALRHRMLDPVWVG